MIENRKQFRVYFKGSEYAKARYEDLTRNDVIYSLRPDGQIIRSVVYECQEKGREGSPCNMPFTPQNDLYDIQFCTGLKDKNGKLIFEGDIIVIPNQYPFYDYKNKEDQKQDLNVTQGEICGESVLNYIGIVEWIYSRWQYVYHCVNPLKNGISEGINYDLDEGYEKGEKTVFEIIGNIYENPELLDDRRNVYV